MKYHYLLPTQREVLYVLGWMALLGLAIYAGSHA